MTDFERDPNGKFHITDDDTISWIRDPGGNLHLDSSSTFATKDYITDLLASLKKVVNGDISVVGTSVTLTIPDTNVILTLTSTSTTSAKITYQAVTGTVSPVDIRRCTLWGGAGIESFTLDNGSLTTTPTIVDDTIYTQSNDSSAHFIRVGGTIYIITVWISANGARASLMYEKVV